MQQISILTRRATAFAKGFASDPLTHWPFPAISRRVYGNLSGFRQNFYGSLHASYHRMTGSTISRSTDPDIRELATRARHDGMFVVSGWLDEDLVQRVRRKISKLVAVKGVASSPFMTTFQDHSMTDAVPEVFSMFNPRIRAFVEAYFSSPFLINSTSYRLTRHVPEEVRKLGEIYSDHWHTDSGPTSVLAMFVLLNDLTHEGGPTAALNIPATKAVIRRGYTSRKLNGAMLNSIENDPAKREMVGPAGTIMFVNVARCLHRAGVPAPGHKREWLQFRLYPCSEPTDTSRLRPARILEWTNGIRQDF